jgi:hypothetical protein
VAFSKGFEKQAGILGMVAKPILKGVAGVAGAGVGAALRGSNAVSGGILGTAGNVGDMIRNTRRNVALADSAIARG